MSREPAGAPGENAETHRQSEESTAQSAARIPVLHSTTRGDGPRIVLVHGFTQTGNSWRRVSRELERDFEVVVPDLPGHGRSPLPDPSPGAPAGHGRSPLPDPSAGARPSPAPGPCPGGGLVDAAHALGEAGGRAAYIGYSLGGRCCLHLALQAPSLVERLVVVGAHPGIADDPSRRLRQKADDERAAQLELGGDAIVPEFIDAWLAGPLFAHLTEDQADRPSRLENSAAGLSASLQTVGTGRQSPLWERLAELEMPVLVVAGALDDKFAALAVQTVEAIGHNARLALVADAGHAVPFERPDAFVALVQEFLASIGEATSDDRAHSAIPRASRAPNAS